MDIFVTPLRCVLMAQKFRCLFVRHLREQTTAVIRFPAPGEESQLTTTGTETPNGSIQDAPPQREQPRQGRGLEGAKPQCKIHPNHTREMRGVL